MHIVTVQFDHGEKTNFGTLLSVFEKSIEHHMPSMKVVTYRIPAPERIVERVRKLSDNSAKLKIWRDHLDIATEPVIFADCDMLCLQPAYHAFGYLFDVAYTQRTQKNGFPMNGGIVMARPTQAARDFFHRWLEVNDKMFADVNFHCKWQIKYGGMNQAAFGYIFESGEYPGKLHQYITREWNAVDCDWQRLDERTVFVHYKSKLRHLVMANHTPTSVYVEAMKLWYAERDR